MYMYWTLLVLLGLIVVGLPAYADDDRPTIALEGPTDGGLGGMRMELEGISVTPHMRAEGLTYAPPTEGPLGARIQFFVRNASDTDVTLNEVLFNREYPLWPMLEGDWAWHDTPNGWPNRARNMPADALSVWTINVVRPTWDDDGRIGVAVKDWSTDAFSVMRTEAQPPEQWISSVTFTAQEGVKPDRMIVHVTNTSDAPMQMTGVRLWLPESRATYRHLFAQPFMDTIETWPSTGVIPPGQQGILIATTDEPLPLTYTAVELRHETNGEEGALWGHVRIKRDIFDIAGGWINSTARDGRSVLLHEPFLKAMKRLYVNSAHIGMVEGYNDDIGSGGLYDQYPIKQFSRLAPIDNYDSEEMLPHIHAVEFLGEPQLPFSDQGRLPQQVFEAFLPYAPTRLPTTITLSDERSFRHYAGLSDYPHYDAYRVIAPAADVWRRYDRWPDGKRIGWGAPLEGIGELSRVLRDMSRPRPCAIWSQGPWSGWYEIDGRTRLSPTAEELRSQAYHALATRIISLYWFNLSLRSITQYRDTLEEMTRIGREIYMLEDYYMDGDAYRFTSTTNNDGAPDWELSSILAPQGLLMFALDLDYAPDHEAKVFRFNPPRPARFTFELPPHLPSPGDVFRVDADGVYDVDWTVEDNTVVIEDEATLAAIYVAATDEDQRTTIAEKRNELIAQEEAIGFDPANNDADFEKLLALLPE